MAKKYKTIRKHYKNRDTEKARSTLVEEIRHIDNLLETHTMIIIGSAVMVWGGTVLSENYWIIGLSDLTHWPCPYCLIAEMERSIERLGKIFIEANAKLRRLEDYLEHNEATKIGRTVFIDCGRLVWIGYHHIYVLAIALLIANIMAFNLWLFGMFPFKGEVCTPIVELHKWLVSY